MRTAARPDLTDGLAKPLRIIVREQDTTTIIEVVGEWDLAEQDAAREAIRSVLAQQPVRVSLDLRRLTFIDSSGIGGVVELAQKAAKLQIDLRIMPAPQAVHRTFELCALNEVLPFITETVPGHHDQPHEPTGLRPIPGRAARRTR